MLAKFLHGLVFGAGFAIAVAIVWTIHTLIVLPAVVMSRFDAAPVRSINGDPVEVLPGSPAAAADDRKFELHEGGPSRMEIPTGGGVLSLAITAAPKSSDRPSTIQAWVTEQEAFLIETVGETPTVKKVPYPKADAVEFAGELVREYAGFREGNLTTTIDAVEVRGLRNGVSSSHSDMNGVLRITEQGVVFFVPNKFET